MDNKKNKFLFVNSSDFLLIRLIAFLGQGITLGVTQYFFDITEFVISKKYCVTPKVMPCPTNAIKRISKKSDEFTKRNLFFLLSNLDI